MWIRARRSYAPSLRSCVAFASFRFHHPDRQRPSASRVGPMPPHDQASRSPSFTSALHRTDSHRLFRVSCAADPSPSRVFPSWRLLREGRILRLTYPMGGECLWSSWARTGARFRSHPLLLSPFTMASISPASVVCLRFTMYDFFSCNQAMPSLDHLELLGEVRSLPASSADLSTLSRAES